MSVAPPIQPPAVRWDLSDLFESLENPRIAELWWELKSRAERFAASYRGRINADACDAGTLAGAIAELEAITQEASKPLTYAQLRFSTESTNPSVGAFLQKQQEIATELNVVLMFFELELQALPESRMDELLADERLENYRHYIEVTRSFSPHRLSEPEEIVLEETANTGSRAWVRFFDETTGGHSYEYIPPEGGPSESLNQSQVIAKLSDPDRAVRQAGADALTVGLRQLEKPIVFTYNTLLQDKSVEDRLRRMPYAEHSRHLSNELDRDTVDLVVKLCVDHYGLVERFYNVKRQILGLDKLTHIDRYAPLFENEEPVEWERAKEIVLDSFGSFSETMAKLAGEFFEGGWIDAEPRAGKRGGAFCMYVTPDLHPYVLMSYLNKSDDVMTLAHELGHGVHASLSREQSYFNFHGTLPLAELASTFGEMLVFERIVADSDTKGKLALYASKIESIFATVFRQAALYRFEKRSHEERRNVGEITAERFGDFWQEEVQAMFRSSVELGDQHRMWWSYVGHFFHYPFYVYAYSFGELLVLSLYQMARSRGKSFAESYISLLRRGGSQSPQDLMASVGIDMKSRAFWLGGFEAMEALVTEFERLWAEYSGAAQSSQ